MQALKSGQIDGIVVDLPTAFYLVGPVQVKNGKIVGQFPAAPATRSTSGCCSGRAARYRDCVNKALDEHAGTTGC